MNVESKINVHHSSLAGLKAELLRKQAEVEAVKASHQNIKFLTKPIKEKKPKENEKKEEKKSKKVQDEDIDSMKALKKSQLMLQAKSRLYSKLSKTHTNMNPNFLVDFENKPDYSDHSEEETRKDDEDEDYGHSSDSDSEWVEYTDCFGRTRKCLREDLPKMQEKDDKLRDTISKSPRENLKEQMFVEDREPTKEPAIEAMRRKWEEQSAKLADKVDIHYQDILFDEARAHGVGYYAFSQDEEERAKQQESLTKLRKETEKRQKENQEIRDIKERMQQNRLKVAMMRKRIRAGLPPEETEEEKAENNSVTNLENNEAKEIVSDNEDKKKKEDENSELNIIKEPTKEEIARKKLEETEKKVKAFGDLLGKRNKWYVMSQEEWVQKKRKERIDDFAPVYENFKQGETLDLKNSIDNAQENLASSDDSDVIGPMPPPQDASPEIRPVPLPSNVWNEIGPVPPSPTNISNVIEPIPPPLDESYFIGPMPASLDESHSIGPVPPPNIEENSQSNEGSTFNAEISIEAKIEAGLKFLREQFESKNRR